MTLAVKEIKQHFYKLETGQHIYEIELESILLTTELSLTHLCWINTNTAMGESCKFPKSWILEI